MLFCFWISYRNRYDAKNGRDLGHLSRPRNALNIANINNAAQTYFSLSRCFVPPTLSTHDFVEFLYWSRRLLYLLIPSHICTCTHWTNISPKKYCWKRIDRPWIPRGLLVCSAQIFGISKGIFICLCITLYNIYLYYRRSMTGRIAI